MVWNWTLLGRKLNLDIKNRPVFRECLVEMLAVGVELIQRKKDRGPLREVLPLLKIEYPRFLANPKYPLKPEVLL